METAAFVALQTTGDQHIFCLTLAVTAFHAVPEHSTQTPGFDGTLNCTFFPLLNN